MMTESPKPSSPDPVACRVVLWKERMTVEDRSSYLRAHVRIMKEGETEQEPVKSLMRLIYNNITALSDGQTADPPVKEGTPIVDEALKVNQATLELVADKIAEFL